MCVYVTLAETRTRKQHQIPPQPGICVDLGWDKPLVKQPLRMLRSVVRRNQQKCSHHNIRVVVFAFYADSTLAVDAASNWLWKGMERKAVLTLGGNKVFFHTSPVSPPQSKYSDGAFAFSRSFLIRSLLLATERAIFMTQPSVFACDEHGMSWAADDKSDRFVQLRADFINLPHENAEQ